MLKGYSISSDNLSHTFMGGKLKITVGKDKDYWAVVEYKGYNYCLPEDLKTLFDSILPLVDYKYDVAKIVYEKMEHEVNEMLARFQMREAQKNVVQFQFPPAKEAPRITVGGTSIGWNLNPSPARVYASDGIRTDTRRDSTPIANYLTEEEYEQKRERGELTSGNIYLVYSN